MPRKGEQFAGLTVALVTPFRDGTVDEGRLKANVDWQVDQGTAGVAPCGTTGESPTLSHDEHERIIDLVCTQSAGRIKVIAGTGSNSTAEAVRLTKSAQRSGADAALMVAPYYNKPTQEGFYRHFATVADACDLPIVLYNIPGRTGKNMEPETICRLAEVSTIVAVKESTGDLDQASAIAAGCDLTILSGDDSLTLPIMSVGGSGAVSVAGNIVPADLTAMIDAFRNGDPAAALQRHAKLFPLCRALLGLSSNPIPLKAAMARLGHDTGEVRLPLVELDSATMPKLEQALADYGLL
ncbi:4-hydroxy-tetrahydrodipicolinate synthase [Alienimonas chondri]|uniref:4-hydroxy-tetrahydrodipicolinate synthase n=1 Tax=Alienimonas chondri TaxID=2681879 RepID=A0ABX1VBE0_9PLAN|nr:4-hydroxy-tetrahydrodipicolinate synthase [Alienimonas chondri]NNJ25419.1 4-hydroxy-tetrahydrodipicolinate synthase [Alienimonas chondri]